MNTYRVIPSPSIVEDIEPILSFITSINNEEHAHRYVDMLFDEIDTLSYMADVIPDCDLKTVKRFHPQAKYMITHNRKWTIIFHIQQNYVVVDKIIASLLVAE